MGFALAMMPRHRTRLLAVLLAFCVVASACASNDLNVGESSTEIPPGLLDPTEAGEATPDGYRESLPRDAIAPIYVPTFVSAAGVDWPRDELVIGVDLEGEQRAYPVGLLTVREIVVDDHRGIPTLVTW